VKVRKQFRRHPRKTAFCPLARLIPAYPRQPVAQLVFPGLPLTVSTTVTTGVIASLYEIKASNILNFATRVGSLFEEYRIVHAKFNLLTFSSTNPGLIVDWIDEKDTSAPTSTEARQKVARAFPAALAVPHVLSWTSVDPLDLQYIDIGTTTTSLATFKIYTDNAFFGSSTTATPYFTVVPEFTVQFRGFN
jgi:hypothetical protein